MQAQIEDDAAALEQLPPNLAYDSEPEAAEATEAAAAPEPEVDWKARFEEAERARNGILRDLQEERRANRERDARLEEIRQAIIDRGGEPEPEAPAPSKDDPVAYLDHQLGDLRRRVDTLGTMTVEQRQAAEQRAEQERMNQVAQRFVATVNESARRKTTEAPDFPDAVNYGANLLREHLASQGVPEDRIPAAIQAEFASIAYRALQENADPATRIYEAVKRFGYQPKAQAQADPVSQPVSQPEPRKAPQARSLSNVGGASGSKAKITADEFLNLPQSEQYKIALDEEKMKQLTTQGFVYA